MTIRLIKHISVFAFSFIVCVLCWDYSIRTFFPDFNGYDFRKPGHNLAFILKSKLAIMVNSKIFGFGTGTEFDQQVGWVESPNVTYHTEGITYTNNSAGFRSQEIDPTKKQILLVGDSVVYGGFVNNDETISHYLQKKYQGYQVLNLGGVGYGISQYYFFLKKHIKELKPERVVVVIGTGQDTSDVKINGLGASKPYYTIKNKELLTEKSNVDPDSLILIDDHVGRFSCYNIFLLSNSLKFFGLHHLQDYFCPATAGNRFETRYIIEALLLKIQKLVKESGAKLTYVLSPDRFTFINLKETSKSLFNKATHGLPQNIIPKYIFYTPEILMWNEFMKKNQFDHIELFSRFLDKDLTDKDLFIDWTYDNYHYSPKGSQIIADIIFKHFNK